VSKLYESAIRKLHPTQITVGIIEVADKCIELASLKPHERREFLSTHPIPAVIGPEDKLYITDHHHLAAPPGTKASRRVSFLSKPIFRNSMPRNSGAK
jgi:hypothetical protein